MWRRLRKPLLWLMVVEAIAWATGQILARRLSTGGESSDEFRVAAILGGKRFRSTARRLRAGSVVASMGGVELDLRDATLDPDGATLDVDATMGGVQIMVPPNWAVEIDKQALAGGVEARVTARESLPEDAPHLHVRAAVRMGGALVTTGPDH